MSQPPRHTIDELIANSSLTDLTGSVERHPTYRYAIGEGSGGTVYRGIYTWQDSTADTPKTHSLNVVIKIHRGTPAEIQQTQRRLNREIATWSSLNHPNVVRLLGTAELIPGSPPGIVLPWIRRNNFLAYIGRHPGVKRKMAREIACGLKYLHEMEVFDDNGEKGIVHGDLKVDNILVSEEGVAQITDFGIARILGVQGYTTTTARNVRYAAPELRPLGDADLKAVRPTTASDIFSLGILFLQLFHGPDEDVQRGRPYNDAPYNHITGDYALLVHIHNGGRPIRALYNFIQDQHWALMVRCWATDPLGRPGIAEVLEEL